MLTYCGFNCLCLIINDSKHLFHVILAILTSPLVKCLSILSILKIRLFIFLQLNYMHSVHLFNFEKIKLSNIYLMDQILWAYVKVLCLTPDPEDFFYVFF